MLLLWWKMEKIPRFTLSLLTSESGREGGNILLCKKYKDSIYIKTFVFEWKKNSFVF